MDNSLKLDQTLNFTNRAKSFSLRSNSITNNVIQKLQRRVSFRAPSCSMRQSFHMRSKDHLSIYRVSEASNESPDKVSNSKRNSVNRRRDKSQSGRISASFYFHANRLSAWQSNASGDDGAEYVDELSEIVVPVPKSQKKTLSLTLHMTPKNTDLAENKA